MLKRISVRDRLLSGRRYDDEPSEEQPLFLAEYETRFTGNDASAKFEGPESFTKVNPVLQSLASEPERADPCAESHAWRAHACASGNRTSKGETWFAGCRGTPGRDFASWSDAPS